MKNLKIIAIFILIILGLSLASFILEVLTSDKVAPYVVMIGVIILLLWYSTHKLKN